VPMCKPANACDLRHFAAGPRGWMRTDFDAICTHVMVEEHARGRSGRLLPAASVERRVRDRPQLFSAVSTSYPL